MPKSIECILNGKLIGIIDALKLHGFVKKYKLGYSTFLCKKCRKPVKPHHVSDAAGAHFEHFKLNPNCNLSDAYLR